MWRGQGMGFRCVKGLQRRLRSAADRLIINYSSVLAKLCGL